MATLQQKQHVIDCLRARVITITLDRYYYDLYQQEWNRDGEGDQETMETAYYNLKDDYVHQLRQHGYDDIDDWDQWHDAFEYAYLDGANAAPVFSTQTGEAIKLRFEWFEIN
jgi:hypothetical protein